MSPWEIRIGNDSVTIEGSEDFVAHMQGVVIGALQSAPLTGAGTATGAKRGPGRPRKSAGAKRAAGRKKAGGRKKATAKRATGGKKRGRQPGRTINGKYYAIGAAPPAGYRDVNGKLVPATGAKVSKKTAGRKKAGRRKKAAAKRTTKKKG